jgi:polyhydroxyalkanoate synthesis regulator phasin
MSEPDFGNIQRQLGEVMQGLRALAETIELRHDEAAVLHDLVRADLATLRRDQKYLEEKLDCVICVMQHDLEQFRFGAIASARSVDALTLAVQELRRPVADIVALRSRVAGLILGLGVIGSAIVWLSEPIYRWIVELHYPRQ